jgi:hypothetical protein
MPIIVVLCVPLTSLNDISGNGVTVPDGNRTLAGLQFLPSRIYP